MQLISWNFNLGTIIIETAYLVRAGYLISCSIYSYITMYKIVLAFLRMTFLGFFQFSLMGSNNYNNMKSNFLQSTDHLKNQNKASLKSKTVAVTRSYAPDFEKKYPENGVIFVIVRKANSIHSFLYIDLEMEEHSSESSKAVRTIPRQSSETRIHWKVLFYVSLRRGRSQSRIGNVLANVWHRSA